MSCIGRLLFVSEGRVFSADNACTRERTRATHQDRNHPYHASLALDLVATSPCPAKATGKLVSLLHLLLHCRFPKHLNHSFRRQRMKQPAQPMPTLWNRQCAERAEGVGAVADAKAIDPVMAHDRVALQIANSQLNRVFRYCYLLPIRDHPGHCRTTCPVE